MALMIIPILRLAPTPSIATTQFNHTVNLGARYMQTSSRSLAAALALLTAALYQPGDSSWKYCVAALVLLFNVAWYEVVFIFPTNDRIATGKVGGEEMRVLLDSWQRWHWGRILMPAVSGCIVLFGAVRGLMV